MSTVAPTGVLKAETASLLALCHVLDTILVAKHGANTNDLLETVRCFWQAHIRAYGKSSLKPKHHYLFHNALRSESSAGELQDCVVHERKHQLLKAAADKIKNTIAFEASVAARILLEQSRQIQDLPVDRGLLQRSPAIARLAAELGCASAMVGRHLRWYGAQLGEGDFVLFRDQAGLVRCGVDADGAILALVEPLTLLSTSPSSSTWALQPEV